jgi:hypothetical protein
MVFFLQVLLNTLYAIIFAPMSTACLAHPILVDMITVIIRLGRCTNYEIPHYSVFFDFLSFHLSQDQIFSSAPCSRTPLVVSLHKWQIWRQKRASGPEFLTRRVYFLTYLVYRKRTSRLVTVISHPFLWGQLEWRAWLQLIRLRLPPKLYFTTKLDLIHST